MAMSGSRGDLSDAQWKLTEPLLPKQKRGGRWNDHRLVFNGILWILRTGAPWRDLPERYGKWGSVHHCLSRWRKDGTFDRVLKALCIRLEKQGYIDWDLWCVDGSSVRALRSAAGASKKAKSSRKAGETTRWVAREAGGDQSSTWSLTAEEFPWSPSSAPGKRTSRRASSK
jgi:transposase